MIWKKLNPTNDEIIQFIKLDEVTWWKYSTVEEENILDSPDKEKCNKLGNKITFVVQGIGAKAFGKEADEIWEVLKNYTKTLQ